MLSSVVERRPTGRPRTPERRATPPSRRPRRARSARAPRDAASASAISWSKVSAQDPHATADAQRSQRPLIDPVANRLLIELQDRGDLGDGQELVVDVGRATLSAHAGVIVWRRAPARQRCWPADDVFASGPWSRRVGGACGPMLRLAEAEGDVGAARADRGRPDQLERRTCRHARHERRTTKVGTRWKVQGARRGVVDQILLGDPAQRRQRRLCVEIITARSSSGRHRSSLAPRAEGPLKARVGPLARALADTLLSCDVSREAFLATCRWRAGRRGERSRGQGRRAVVSS